MIQVLLVMLQKDLMKDVLVDIKLLVGYLEDFKENRYIYDVSDVFDLLYAVYDKLEILKSVHLVQDQKLKKEYVDIVFKSINKSDLENHNLSEWCFEIPHLENYKGLVKCYS